MISFIWAEDLDGYIGKNNTMPWHLPSDLKHFKALTVEKTIVMGTNTYLSLGKPLPNRRNIVVSHSLEKQAGIEIVRSIEELADKLEDVDGEIVIIGGAKIFAETLPLVNRLYRTVIKDHFNGDTKIIAIDYNQWRLIQSESFEPDEKNKYSYDFETWEKL
ncbi:dihydrofolate reductase [Paucilactobacillus nenjiangensis]|uniref:dihydrofolate reductase n=1 Tax=Paucilactobacillus nenjiangensis TaxID=1296540 RepID=UPI003BAE8B46